VRQNHIAFADEADDINQSVSRAHAHLRVDAASGEVRLHDDGSTHGTRVMREGRTIEVPASSARGVKVKDGDELVFGQARVKLEVK
jgi:pSer/pThr/pTyr-binding forkhead associated (FHA) protein